MKFLFTTLQWFESEFYGRVTQELARRGHDCVHVTFSRRSAMQLRRRGFTTYVLPELTRAAPLSDVNAEAERIEARYMTPETPTIRDVYRTDRPCYGKPEDWCVERTVRHFLALERTYDEVRPDVVMPEVGSEMMRTVTHLVGLDRQAPVLFLFYTIFRDPLRLYRDTLHAPVVPQEELRPLGPEEERELDAFIAGFKAKGKPIREYRLPAVSPKVAREFARHVAVKLVWDRDNDYNTPLKMVPNRLREKARSIVTPRFYRPLREGRPFVYFPIHVTDDYKIKRVIPHCVDQGSIVEQVAEALPHGYDIVLKEHPMSIGRNSLGLMRRFARIPNARIVDPYTGSHELIQRSQAVIVISSTVGLEALLYERPVLTMGQPFFSGYGVTLDVDSFYEIREKVPAVLKFRPDGERIRHFLHAAMRACYPGAPVLVDPSDENAARLARSLEAAAQGERPRAEAVAA